MKLLDKAKEFRQWNHPPRKVSAHEVEAALAWLNDEITLNALARARGAMNLGGNGMATYVRIAVALKQAYKNGNLKIKCP